MNQLIHTRAHALTHMHVHTHTHRHTHTQIHTHTATTTTTTTSAHTAHIEHQKNPQGEKSTGKGKDAALEQFSRQMYISKDEGSSG